MFNRDMKTYNFFTFGAENGYGQKELSALPQGKIKMALYLSSQSIQDNINYKGCQYIGLTHDNINDTFVIENGNKKLKVLYINPTGRLKQVFLAEL